MQNSNIELYYSVEIITEIIKNMNNVISKIQIVKDKINKLSEFDTWNSINAEYFKSKCDYTLNGFISECSRANELIRSLMKNLEEYEALDKKNIESLYGNMSL